VLNNVWAIGTYNLGCELRKLLTGDAKVTNSAIPTAATFKDGFVLDKIDDDNLTDLVMMLMSVLRLWNICSLYTQRVLDAVRQSNRDKKWVNVAH
jgi:hypothetical protein